MNLRKSICSNFCSSWNCSCPMTVFAAHTRTRFSQYYGYEDEMPGIYDDWDKCAKHTSCIITNNV